MKVSDKKIQEMKDILEKRGGKEVTWTEASDASTRLSGLMELLLKHAQEDWMREQKLKEYPKGFSLGGVGYSCFICGQGTSLNGNWYDKYGIKCMVCQDSINRKEIPASLSKDKESWYSKYDLEGSFNLKAPTLRGWIKRGIIKARTLTYNGKGIHYQVFLIKDNKGFLPPKHMVKNQFVSEEIDGKIWHHSEPWYKFVDPFEHLKDYGIMKYMSYTEVEK